MKLLLLSLALNTFSSPVIENLTVKNASTNFYYDSSNTIKQSLNDIDLKNITINLSSKSSENYTEKSAINAILLGEADAKENSIFKKNIIQIIKNYNKNEDDWLVEGSPGRWPKSGERIILHIEMLYLGDSSDFENTLVFDVSITNEEITNDLSRIIKINSIAFIDNPSVDDILDRIAQVNNLNKNFKDEVILNNYDYFKGTILPKSNSTFFGWVNINYNITFNEVFSNKFKTDEIYVEAYNSWRGVDSVSKTYSFKPMLGIKKFIDDYKYITYAFDGSNWDNVNYRNYLNKNTIEEYWSGATKVMAKKISIKDNLGNYDVFRRDYNGLENNAHSYGTLQISITSTTINFSLKTNASVYATAWNAVWAESKVYECTLSQISFLKS